MFKESYFRYMLSRNDKRLNMGEEWRKSIIKRNISTYLYNDEKRRHIIDIFDKFLQFLIIETSNIKNFFNYAKQKDQIDAN